MEQLPKITTFLMFSGQAEDAMNFYASLFSNSKIDNLMRNEDGSVMKAVLMLNGQTYMCMDSTVKHDFTFTPAISLYVTCETEEEIDRLCLKLSEGGEMLMPLDNYGFSRKFAWLNDRFGVSWQLNLQ